MGLAELGRHHHRRRARREDRHDRGLGGPILPASAYLDEEPAEQIADDVARAQLEAFIIGAE